ncbi:AMP-binding protein, partial [bacterium]|nr:AMP-binding protein [bacterium]
GYWGHPQLTKGVIEDGWFHTGDIGQLDRDGFLKITDRKKDLIVTSNGKNVAPRHIETILATNKFVAQACVVGDRRPFLTAVIVPEQDEIFTWGAKRGQTYESFADMAASPAVRELFDKIVDDVNKRMASYQRIRGYILSDVEFTQENNLLTATQKVRRKEVDRRFSHELEHLY